MHLPPLLLEQITIVINYIHKVRHIYLNLITFNQCLNLYVICQLFST